MALTLGLYQPGSSPVHRLPAGAKLLTLVAAAVATGWLLDRPVRVGVGLVVVLACYAVAGLPARLLAAQLRALAVLLLVLAGFQWLVAGWQQAVVVTGDLLLLVLLAGLVTLTTRTTALIDTVVAACRPLRPLGVSPERVGLLLALGIRAVPVVAELSRQVREAQLARGAGGSPIAYAVPFVVRSLRHAESLGEALVARGFDD